MVLDTGLGRCLAGLCLFAASLHGTEMLADELTDFSRALDPSEPIAVHTDTVWLAALDDSAVAEYEDSQAADAAALEKTPAAPPAEKEYNDGQDPTRPLWRMDLRYRYLQNDGDTESHIGTVRFDMPVPLDPEKGIPGGAVYTRVDLPFAYTDQVGLDNPNGDYEFEMTDSLVQNIFLPDFSWVKKNTPFDAIAVGVQWGIPTGGGDFVSSEQWALAPVFAWKWDLDGPETFIAPVWRYRVDIANRRNGGARDDINELSLQPLLSISTKKWGWPIDFITFYETQEIKLNFADENGRKSGDVFIPFEIEAGKVIPFYDTNAVVSANFAFPLYKSDSFDSYDWFMELRFGVFF